MTEFEQPNRDKVVAAFLETALLVPQSTDNPGEIRRRGPAWLRKAYGHTFRHDICKELAAMLVPPSTVEPYHLSMGPLLTEPVRQGLIDELVQAAPIPNERENRIAEAIRLSGIHMLQKPSITAIMHREETKRALREILDVLSDEELVEKINQERCRVADDALKPVTISLAF